METYFDQLPHELFQFVMLYLNPMDLPNFCEVYPEQCNKNFNQLMWLKMYVTHKVPDIIFQETNKLQMREYTRYYQLLPRLNALKKFCTVRNKPVDEEELESGEGYRVISFSITPINFIDISGMDTKFLYSHIKQGCYYQHRIMRGHSGWMIAVNAKSNVTSGPINKNIDMVLSRLLYYDKYIKQIYIRTDLIRSVFDF
jgi:hypothetical protein